MRRKLLGVLWALPVLAGLSAESALAGQTELVHLSSISLADQFNGATGYGDNPLSVAFDGASAYVGGYNNAAAAASIGVVKVSNIFGAGAPVFTPMAATQFSSPALRGLDALAYHGGTGSLLMAHDSGSAGTSFISRRDATTGATVWNVASPQSSRPFAMAVDPLGDGGSAGVAFLTQGSGRRRLLSMASGATVFDGTNGGIINTSPASGTTWRAMAFDDEGNIVLTNQDVYGYGDRLANNQWQTLGGSANLTSRSVLRNVAVNNVGQGIAIMDDVGSDLLAMSGRNMTTFTDLNGAVTNVVDTSVHIRNLDGSTTGLSQIELRGDEDGIGTPWTGDTKNLAFGHDAAGNPILVVVDFIERRLDVYSIPEPGTVALLAIGGLVLLRRRSTIRTPHASGGLQS